MGNVNFKVSYLLTGSIKMCQNLRKKRTCLIIYYKTSWIKKIWDRFILYMGNVVEKNKEGLEKNIRQVFLNRISPWYI